jgi:hypothetical protein
MRAVFPITAAVAAACTASQTEAAFVPTGSGTASITDPAVYQGASSPANGAIIVNFDGSVNKTAVSGLTAQLTLTFLGYSGSSYYFSYSLGNNSTISSRVSGFAFDTLPDAIGGAAQGTFTGLTVDGNYPNGVKAIDVCLSNDKGQGCSGPGGVSNIVGANPGTGTFSLLFSGPAPTKLDLSNFHVRYQDVVSRVGNSGTGNFVGFTKPPAVPEPGTWGMMLLGFAGVGAAVRRKSIQQVPQLT